MADKCTTIRVTGFIPPYRQGEVAGFPDEIARAYIAAGRAELVARDVDVVAPRIREHDARRRADELRHFASVADAEAELHAAEATRQA